LEKREKVLGQKVSSSGRSGKPFYELTEEDHKAIAEVCSEFGLDLLVARGSVVKVYEDPAKGPGYSIKKKDLPKNPNAVVLVEQVV